MYNYFTLFGIGTLGVLLHTLVELNKIKKSNPDGDVNYQKYFKIEWISILISFFVVVATVWLSQEIKELANAGKWIGLGILAIGYLAQSVLISFMGKAQNVINTKIES